MGLLALAALGLFGWLWFTGRLGPDAGRKIALVAGAGLAAWLVARGQHLTGLAVAAATAGLALAGQLRRRVSAIPLDELEARQILGVGLNAGEDEIIAAHRRRIAEVHPDRGGDPDIARRVNAARDLLLQIHRRRPG
ncbi:J domain-containing protein [Sandaracinobacteroides sp. A072]|uniref:J domain-containing protein n=1 Tax=Sandaracinobacteroides sp. A072 TaxID=3461146 RepID=UPI004042CE4E